MLNEFSDPENKWNMEIIEAKVRTYSIEGPHEKNERCDSVKL